MDKKKQQIIDIIQWILIIFLVGVCFYIYIGSKSVNRREKEIKTDNTYIKIYESQKIKELEDKNKELYDSISVLNDVESAIQIKFKYKYKTDTIRVSEFDVVEDSVYHYHNETDTLLTDVKIKAKDLEWCDVNTSINEKFTIITQEKYNQITTRINHSENVEILNFDAYHKKNNWRDKLYYGPSVGVGYGMINNKFDTFVGFSIGYKF